MGYRVKIIVERKPGVADPEGSTITDALKRLGNQSVIKVNVSKLFVLQVEAVNPSAAKAIALEIGKTILSNPIIETFSVFTIEEIHV